MTPVKLGLVGIGKIARDQHIPAIYDEEQIRLVATASHHGCIEGVPAFDELEEMIAACGPDAISLCTPPNARFFHAMTAIRARAHVMLEKPPAATLSHVDLLVRAANEAGVTLFTAWHSREAAAVDAAREWLLDKEVRAVRIDWREDIRQWHPGQEWILGPGGFGVFDPGINALSIATHILPDDLLVEQGQLDFPENRASPIAARLTMRCGRAGVEVHLDFLQTGPQTWSIEVDTDAGTLRLSMGGRVLHLPGEAPRETPDEEYSRLYSRFIKLIAERKSDVDVRPLRLVADAFSIADRRRVAPFSF